MRSAVQSFLAAALGLLVLAGCGGGDDGGGDCDPIAATLVSRIEVTPTTAAVADGESAQLTAKAFSCSGSQLSPTFTWQSTDATTVSVSAEGLVSGVKIGGPVTVKASAQGKEGSADDLGGGTLGRVGAGRTGHGERGGGTHQHAGGQGIRRAGR